MSDIDKRNKNWSYRNGRTPVNAHRGHYRSYLRRYEREADEAVANGVKGIAELAPDLLKHIADVRSLRIAFNYLKQFGGQAPGPDGLRYSDLSNQEVWELMKVLNPALLKGRGVRAPSRCSSSGSSAAGCS